MASHKLQRSTEDIRRELTDILRTLKDPRVQGVFLSIVRVEVTNDFSYCKVYILSLIHISLSNPARTIRSIGSVPCPSSAN